MTSFRISFILFYLIIVHVVSAQKLLHNRGIIKNQQNDHHSSSIIRLSNSSTNSNSSKLEGWIKNQYIISKTKLLQNISPPGARRGAIIASPSTENPNYFFNWVRDSALVSDALVTLWLREENEEDQEAIELVLSDVADFNLEIMNVSTPCQCFGEPKFLVDGQAFTEPWGRPQNDGPSLRALTFIRYLQHYSTKYLANDEFSHENRINILEQLPVVAIIKQDLAYIASVHPDACFIGWEEVNGHHFHARLVQYAALTKGAEFMRSYLNDTKTANNYQSHAEIILERITKDHIDVKAKLIKPSVNVINGPHKYSNLDASIILAVLQAEVPEYSVVNPYVVDTVATFVKVMADLYPINSIKDGEDGRLGPAIGRYPEDVYDGEGTSIGNPWFLTTLAVAQYLYEISLFKNSDSSTMLLVQNQSSRHNKGYAISSRLRRDLIRAGDSFLQRVKKHMAEDGRMSEEYNRHTGFMEGARDLTWSYASFLTAVWARDKAMSELSD